MDTYEIISKGEEIHKCKLPGGLECWRQGLKTHAVIECTVCGSRYQLRESELKPDNFWARVPKVPEQPKVNRPDPTRKTVEGW